MIRVIEVNITPLPLGDGSLPPYIITGQSLSITVDVVENNWQALYKGFSNWSNIKEQLSSWLDVYKY